MSHIELQKPSTRNLLRRWNMPRMRSAPRSSRLRRSLLGTFGAPFLAYIHLYFQQYTTGWWFLTYNSDKKKSFLHNGAAPSWTPWPVRNLHPVRDCSLYARRNEANVGKVYLVSEFGSTCRSDCFSSLCECQDVEFRLLCRKISRSAICCNNTNDTISSVIIIIIIIIKSIYTRRLKAKSQ